jgi:hypothetical protein
LARCVLEDWASAADFAVVVGDLLGAAGSDQAREGLARDAGERKIDNIWVAEDVVKEVLNSRDRIRTAQLEKDHAKLHSNSSSNSVYQEGGTRGTIRGLSFSDILSLSIVIRAG